MASKAFALFLVFNLLLLRMATDAATCPADAVQLGLCANALNLLLIKVGDPPVQPCCTLVDAEAAACLCTIITAGVPGIRLDLPVALSIVLNNCGRPTGEFLCP